jgi:LmeA-like phospholipid-binding
MARGTVSEEPRSPAETRPPAGAGARRRWLWVSLIALAVLVVLAVAADLVAKSAAQAKVAAAIQQQGFPARPVVTIEGFPFLTQVASHDIGQIRISAHNVPEGALRIATVSAVLTGVHLSSGFSRGTVDRLAGTALVTFPALSHLVITQLGPLGSVVGRGLRLTAAGPGEVTASLNLVVASGSATWRVSPAGGGELRARLVAVSGVPSALQGAIRDFTITIPRLPLGVTVSGVHVSPRGVSAAISGRNLPFGG